VDVQESEGAREALAGQGIDQGAGLRRARRGIFIAAGKNSDRRGGEQGGEEMFVHAIVRARAPVNRVQRNRNPDTAGAIGSSCARARVPKWGTWRQNGGFQAIPLRCPIALTNMQDIAFVLMCLLVLVYFFLLRQLLDRLEVFHPELYERMDLETLRLKAMLWQADADTRTASAGSLLRGFLAGSGARQLKDVIVLRLASRMRWVTRLFIGAFLVILVSFFMGPRAAPLVDVRRACELGGSDACSLAKRLQGRR
jgi:hypothetical protein